MTPVGPLCYDCGSNPPSGCAQLGMSSLADPGEGMVHIGQQAWRRRAAGLVATVFAAGALAVPTAVDAMPSGVSQEPPGGRDEAGWPPSSDPEVLVAADDTSA